MSIYASLTDRSNRKVKPCGQYFLIDCAVASKSPIEHGERATQILEAADQLLGECGYDAASIGLVAQRAKVNKALVFYYFNSKENLFQQVLERYYRAHQLALEEAFSSSGSVRERLHQMMDAYFDFIVANDRYPRLVQQLVAGGTQHIDVVKENLAPLYRWITEALSTVTPERGPLAARQFFLTFSAAVINYFTYGPVLADLWGEPPTGATALDERRAHLHWLVDTILDKLDSEAG